MGQDGHFLLPASRTKLQTDRCKSFGLRGPHKPKQAPDLEKREAHRFLIQEDAFGPPESFEAACFETAHMKKEGKKAGETLEASLMASQEVYPRRCCAR